MEFSNISVLSHELDWEKTHIMPIDAQNIELIIQDITIHFQN